MRFSSTSCLLAFLISCSLQSYLCLRSSDCILDPLEAVCQGLLQLGTCKGALGAMVCSLCGRPFFEAPQARGAAFRPTLRQLGPDSNKKRRCCSLPHKTLSRRSSHTRAVISPGICFDAACQQAADRAFLTAVALPLLGLIFAIVWKLRTPEAKPDEGEVMRCL